MRLIDADKIEFVLPRTLTEEEKKTYGLVIKKAFENAPTVEAGPVRHRHWLTSDHGFVTCSRCGNITFEKKEVNRWAESYWDRFTLPNYCSDCGAKMDEEADDD